MTAHRDWMTNTKGVPRERAREIIDAFNKQTAYEAARERHRTLHPQISAEAIEAAGKKDGDLL